MAPHGGSIEQGTTELTKALADKGNYDYYSFEGIRPKNNSELHVTSTHYDDPTLNQMIKTVLQLFRFMAHQVLRRVSILVGPFRFKKCYREATCRTWIYS